MRLLLFLCTILYARYVSVANGLNYDESSEIEPARLSILVPTVSSYDNGQSNQTDTKPAPFEEFIVGPDFYQPSHRRLQATDACFPTPTGLSYPITPRVCAKVNAVSELISASYAYTCAAGYAKANANPAQCSFARTCQVGPGAGFVATKCFPAVGTPPPGDFSTCTVDCYCKDESINVLSAPVCHRCQLSSPGYTVNEATPGTFDVICPDNYYGAKVSWTCSQGDYYSEGLTPTCSVCDDGAPAEPAGVSKEKRPPNHYDYRCSAGYYSTIALHTQTCHSHLANPFTAVGITCKACSNPSGGYYCPGGLLSTTRTQCPAGRYGAPTDNNNNANCSGPCKGGYYCPVGSTSETQVACGGADKYCPTGSSTPSAVDAGHYSCNQMSGSDCIVGPDPNTRSMQALCPVHRRCSNGVILPAFLGVDKCAGGQSIITYSEGTDTTFTDVYIPLFNSDTVSTSTQSFTLAQIEGGTSCTVTTSHVSLVTSGSGVNVRIKNLTYNNCKSGFYIQLNFVYAGLHPYPNNDLTTSCQIRVNVQQVLKKPTLTQCVNQNINEKVVAGTALTTQVKATNPNTGTALVFELFNDGGTYFPFQISSCSGQIKTTGSRLKYTSGHIFNMRVRVTNDGSAINLPGIQYEECTFTVTMIRQPDAPLLSDATHVVEDLQPPNTYVGEIRPWDEDAYPIYPISDWATPLPTPDHFYIDNNKIYVKNYFDAKALDKYLWEYKVNVSSPYRAATRSVFINVKLAPRAPVFINQQRDVPELTGANKSFGVKLVHTQASNMPVVYEDVYDGGVISPIFGVSTDGVLYVKAAGLIDFRVREIYDVQVKLRLRDYHDLFTYGNVKITVIEENKPPYWIHSMLPSPFLLDVPEGSNPSSTIVSQAMVKAVDPNIRDKLTFSGSCTPSDYFSYHGNGGYLYINPSMDASPTKKFYYYEARHTTPSTEFKVTCTFTARDSYNPALSTSTPVHITITKVAPRIYYPIKNFSGITGMTTDVFDLNTFMKNFYPSNPLSFQIMWQERTPEGIASPFVVSGTNLRTNTGPAIPNSPGTFFNYNTKKNYTLTIKATDTVHNTQVTGNITVVLDHKNRSPWWKPLPRSYFTIPSRTKVDIGNPFNFYADDLDLQAAVGEQLTYYLPNTHGGAFKIHASTGQLSVDNELAPAMLYPAEATSPPVHNLDICVRDKGVNGPQLSVCTSIEIELAKDEYPPTFPVFSAITIDEFTPVGTFVTTLCSNDTVSADLDFALVPAGASINRPFPFRAEKTAPTSLCVNVYVQDDTSYAAPCDHSPVIATMNPPCHENTRFDATLSGSDTVRVPGRTLTGFAPVRFNINKIPMAPYFHPDASPFVVPPYMLPNSHTFFLTVPEKSATGFVVATNELKAKSKDYNKANTAGLLQYRWKAGTNPNPSFAINLNTAQVTVTSSATLSHTVSSTYTYTLEVTDTEYGLTDTATVTIEVIDKNDPSTFNHPDAGLFAPDNLTKITGTQFLLREDATVGHVVGYLRAYDEDTHPLWGAKLYQLVSSADSEFFDINRDTGALTVSFAANFDWNDKDLFTLQVRCSDADTVAPLVSSLTFTVRLDQINRVTITALKSPSDVPGNGIIVPGQHPNYPSSLYPGIAILTNTEGGNVVEIEGTGFGKTAARLSREGLTLASTIVTATYGPTGFEQTAISCAVVLANTKIRCTTVPGVGDRNTWIVKINNKWESPPSSDKSGYLPPTILQLYRKDTTPSNNAQQIMPTNGQGALIVVKGSNFGPRLISGSPVAVRLVYGPTGVEYNVPACNWITDHLEVHCPVAEGVGFDFQWMVIVGGQQSAYFSSTTLRYALPTITSVVSPVLTTRGEDLFHIHGTNFGPRTNTDIVVRYSRDPTFTVNGDEPIFYASNCQVPSGKDHIQITCMAAEGMGVGLYVQVEIASQESGPSTGTLAYYAPIINDLLGPGVSKGSTEGGGLVMLSGENFGPSSVIVDGPHPYAHFIPVVHYGAYDFDNDVWLRMYVANECRVVTDSQIQCLTVEGYGTDLYWQIYDLGGQGSHLFTGRTTDYHPPIVAYYSGDGSVDAFTQGGQEVNIEGKNFGPIGTPIDSVVYHEEDGDVFVAEDCEVTAAHNTVTCLTAVGAGKDLAWYVRIGGQDSVSPSTGYGAPIITGFSGPGAVDANTDGGQLVHISGEFFSITKFLNYVTYGPSGTEFVAADCFVSIDHVQITCTTVPGVGRILRWIVSVGGQSSSPSADTTSYAPPQILEIRPVHRMSPTVGGDMFTIVATNAGVTYPSARIQIYVNARGRVPPGVTASDPLAFLYDPLSIPTLRSTYVPSTPVANYWQLAVDAATIPSELVPVRNWIQTLESPRVINPHVNASNHVIQFEMPTGFGLNREVFITVNGIPSNVHLIGYDPPFIRNIAPDRLNVTAGRLRVFVEGSNFCNGLDNCGQVLLNDLQVIPESYAYKDNQLLFIINDLPANAPLQEVRVAVGGVPSNSRFFRKPAPNFNPQVDQGVWKNMNTTGGEVLNVYGVLEIGQEDVTIHIGPYQCLNVTRSVDNGKDPLDVEASFTLSCITPPGVGKNHLILVETLGGTSREDDSFVFDYADPRVDGIFLWPDEEDGRRRLSPFEHLPTFSFEDNLSHGSARLGTAGGYIVLTGANFGAGDLLNETAGIFAEVLMDHLYPLEIVYHTHHYIVIEVPPFEGGTNRVITFSIAGAPSNILEIHAALPEVHSISPTHGPTRGGTRLTISGANFGTLTPIITFVDQLGNRRDCPLETTPYVPSPNHDTIVCLTPHFQGKDVEVRITVSGQDSVVLSGTTPMFNYDPPTIFDVSPRSTTTSGREVGDFASDGIHLKLGNRTVVTLTGENFGTEGVIVFIENNSLLGDSIDPWTNQPYQPIVVPNADIISWADEEVKFYAQPGIGADLRIRINAGNQLSPADPTDLTAYQAISFSYQPPVLASWLRVDRPPEACQPIQRTYVYENQTYVKSEPAQCYDTRGEYTVTLVGASFYTNLQFVTVKIGGKPAIPESVDHGLLNIRVPRGLGDFQLIEVNIKGLNSVTNANSYFHYDSPILDFAVPNTPDALGQRIMLRGKNFGYELTPSKLNISSTNFWYLIEDLDYLGDTVLEFESMNDVVGPKQLELYVASRSAPTIFYHFEERYITECKRGYWGLEGEFCLPCPRGAFCPGSERKDDLTYALPGFWRNYIENPSEICPEEHQNPEFRPYCPIFVACSPPESCIGNNVCAEGYEGERCAFCLTGKYYRVNGECIKCPDSPIAVLIGFVGLALAGIFVSWFLTKYNVTITLLTVGLDYAQVISIFARTKINWPPEITYIFKFLSAFNFNIEIAAPECLLENVTFLNKWLAIELLPIIAICLLFFMFFLKFMYKLLCLQRKRNSLFSHLPQMLSVYIVIFRVLYLFITRSALDVFSCSPTQPPDGKQYMAGMLDVVCGEPGSVQTRLLPYAALAVVFYVVGFPVSAFIFMNRNKSKIKHDQILRAKDWGNDRRTNPKYYSFRKTWHKLYYHFKPGKWYWEVIIIGRKFFIAFTSLMFRQTPDYQLAMALLVLFVAYLLHVKSSPYLTHKDKPKVIAEHQKKAKAGDPLHREIEENMRAVEKANRLNRNTSQLKQLDDVNTFSPNKMSAGDIVLHNIFNHNTVEAVLLACAVLINLAGIMFNSARFQGELKQWYHDEYKSLAYATIVLIAASLIYYIFVLFADILISVAPNVAARVLTCGKIENVINRAKARARGKIFVSKNTVISKTTNFDAGDVDLQVSQLFQQTRLGGINAGGITVDDLEAYNAPPGQVEWMAIKSAFIANIRAVSGLQTDVQKHKRELEELLNAKEIEKNGAEITQQLPNFLTKKAFQSAPLYSSTGNEKSQGSKIDSRASQHLDDSFAVRNPLATASSSAFNKMEDTTPVHEVRPFVHENIDINAIDIPTSDNARESLRFDNPFFANRNPMAASKQANLNSESAPAPDSPMENETSEEPASPESVDESLPAGWFSATDDDGDVYYYTEDGRSQWTVPTEPAI